MNEGKMKSSLALSVALSAILMQGVYAADQNLTTTNDQNASFAAQPNVTTIGSGIITSGTVEANSSVSMSEYTQAGYYSGNTYYSGDDTNATSIGVDFNQSMTDFTNKGSIRAVTQTLDSNGSANVHYDQNNTILKSEGLNISNDIGSITNYGAIDTTATLNNDTNNSTAKATGILVNANISGGIINQGGSITAESKQIVRDKNNGNVLNTYIVGGNTGTSGVYKGDIVSSNNEDLNNTLTAEGILVTSSSKVTGGINNFGNAYISSIKNEGTLEGNSTSQNQNGITNVTGASAITNGSITSRIGNVINTGTIKAEALDKVGYGILMSAKSSSAETFSGNNIASTTSGSASSYFGEGSSSTVSQNSNGDVSNSLIGGLTNTNTIKGGFGTAALIMNADSSTDVNNSANLDLNQTRTVNPKAIVAIGDFNNTGTIQGGDDTDGINIISHGIDRVKTDGNLTGNNRLTLSSETINSIKTFNNSGDIIGTAKASSNGDGIVFKAGDTNNKNGINIGASLDANVSISPVVTSFIENFINSGNIKAATDGTSSGYGIDGGAISNAWIVSSQDINNSSDLSVKPVVSATFGSFTNTGEISTNSTNDAVALLSTGDAKLLSNSVNDSKVNIYSKSYGGIQQKSANANGNFINGGTIKNTVDSSGSMNALNMYVNGKVFLSSSGFGAIKSIDNSSITIKNQTIGGIANDFQNYQTSTASDTNKSINRGTISSVGDSSHGVQTAMKLDAFGTTALDAQSISSGIITLTDTTIGGIGGDFDNNGLIKSDFGYEAVNLSSTARVTLGTTTDTNITDGSTISSNSSTTAGVRGDFKNSAYAFETGLQELNTTKVYKTPGATNHPLVAAQVNNGNPSDDRNSTNPQTNPLIATDVNTTFYNKEATITMGAITGSGSSGGKDLIKFTATSTGENLKVNEVNSSTTKRVNLSTSEIFDTLTKKSNITSTTSSDSSIGGNFINQGEISQSVANNASPNNAINGFATATGTLGTTDLTVNGASLTQSSTSTSGVQGWFENEVVSRDVGNGQVITVLSGQEEVTSVIYNKSTTTSATVKIDAVGVGNAIKLDADSTNSLKTGAINSALAVVDSNRSDSSLSHLESDSLTAKSSLTSETTTTSGIGSNFNNTGTIKTTSNANAGAADNALLATATGSNTVGDDTNSDLNGSTITARATSTSGIQGSFTNDVVSLDTGSATLLYRDVYYYDDQNRSTKPKTYLLGDANESKRVKSNVVENYYYTKTLAKGDIEAIGAGSIKAKDVLKLNATATQNITVANIGTTDVDVVTTNENNESNITSSRTIKVTSDMTATTTVNAGIGNTFINKNIIKSDNSDHALEAVGTSTNTIGTDGTKTDINGGKITSTTTSRSGINNASSSVNATQAFLNAANSYVDGAVKTGTSKIIAGDNNTTHSLTASTADANHLIDSKTLAWYDKTKVVGSITGASNSTYGPIETVLDLQGTATGTIKTKTIANATGDANVTTDGGTTYNIIAVDGYKVSNNAKADITNTTTTYAGINGGFTNQGEISISHTDDGQADDVLNTTATATGNLGHDGGTAKTDITGATVANETTTYGGVRGWFKNEVQSLDYQGNIATALSSDGTTESAKVWYSKQTTAGEVILKATNGDDVLNFDSSSTNKLIAQSISASNAVLGTYSSSDTLLDEALSARANVNSTTKAYGGVWGDFSNTGEIFADNGSNNAIISSATSNNDLGAASSDINGSVVTSSSISDSRIRGSFTNDAVLLDDGNATVTYKKTDDGNDSNVVDTLIYSQKLVKGSIKALADGNSATEDVLNLVATGNNDVILNNVANKQITVAAVDQNGYVTGSASDINVSSSVTSESITKSGIGGTFTNRGDMKTTAANSAASDVIDMQAIGGASVVDITKLGGGSVTSTNTVLTGINIDGSSSSIAFLNDKKDFNTVLKTDADYNTSKVAIGLIKATGAAAAAGNAISLLADGGADTTVTSDSVVYTNGSTPTNTATVSNTGDNQAIINGDFVNKGTIEAYDAGYALEMNAANSVSNTVTINNDTNGTISSTSNGTVKSKIVGELNNSGTIKSTKGANRGKHAISLVSNGGTSTLTATLNDENITKNAANNGIVIAENKSVTETSIGSLTNSGTIQAAHSGLAGANAVYLKASGTADSSGSALTSLTGLTASNAVIKNVLTSTASIGTLNNSGEIKVTGATGATDAIKVEASGEAIRKTTVGTDIATFETTTATVTASIGDIINDAFTTHNKKRDVNSSFTGGQLKPEESIVKAYRGEYDFTDLMAGNKNTARTSYDLNTSLYSSSSELNALAYESNDPTKNPILSQTVGQITTNYGTAMSFKATVGTNANSENDTDVKTIVGDITNKGIINGLGTGGKGMVFTADGISGKGKATVTVGTIKNTISYSKVGELNTFLLGSIRGTSKGIVLNGQSDSDMNVSNVTVQKIVNDRLILHKGDKVLSSDGVNDDGKVTNSATKLFVSTVNTNTLATDNYEVLTLQRDKVYSAAISGADASIDISKNAHVAQGIHNYGTLTGDVKLGDADLYLYGIMDDNSTDSGNLNHTVLTQAQFNADTHTQVAGKVNGNITDALSGSSINMEGNHIFKASPVWSADEIIIDSAAVANIADDTIFDTTTATAYKTALMRRFTNRGTLNIRAGKVATINGSYDQTGELRSNIITSKIVADDDTEYNTAGGAFGQLKVNGTANFKSGHTIFLAFDDKKSRDYWMNMAKSGKTRLSDLIDANATTANGTAIATASTKNDTEITSLNVKSNLTYAGFKWVAVQGDGVGNIDMLLKLVSLGKPLMTGDIVQVQRIAAADFADLVSTRLDQTSGYGIDYSRSLNTHGGNQKGTNKNFGENVKTRWLSFKERMKKALKERNYWVKPFGSISKQDKSNNSEGFDSSTYGIALGTDKDYLNGWRTGFAFAFAKTDVDSTSGPQHNDKADQFQFIGYTSKKLSKGVINLQLGYGLMKNEGSRRDDTMATTLTSKFDSTVIQAKIEYERAFKSIYKNTTVIPYVSALASRVESDGYTESGDITAALKVDSTTADSLVLGGGVKTRYDMQKYDATFVSHLGFGYDTASKAVHTKYTPVAGGDIGTVIGSDPERLQWEAGLGLQYRTKNDNRVLFSYDYKGRKGYQNHVGSLKFVMPFGK